MWYPRLIVIDKERKNEGIKEGRKGSLKKKKW